MASIMKAFGNVRASVRLDSPKKAELHRSSISTTSTDISQVSDVFALQSSPLAMMLAGGRQVRMEGILKEKGRMGFYARFAVLEEGRFRVSKTDLDNLDDKSKDSESLNLTELLSIKYSKRGNLQFTLVFTTKVLRLKALSGEEAEVWIQHILTELKNQCQLMEKCASLLIKHDQNQNVETIYRAIIRMQKLANGDEHEAVVEAMDNLADYLEKIGRLDESEQVYRQAEDIRAALQMKPDVLTRRGSGRAGSGLQELQVWLNLKERAAKGEDIMQRNDQLRQRERQLIEFMEKQHEEKINELSNRVIEQEQRAREAEAQLQQLGKSVKPKDSVAKRLSKRLSARRSTKKVTLPEEVREALRSDTIDEEDEENQQLSNTVKKEVEEEEEEDEEDAESDDDDEELAKEEEALKAKLKKLKEKKKKKKQQQQQNASLQGSLQRTIQKTDDTACYLVYREDSEGTLQAVWSMTPVEDSIGKFYPGEGVKVRQFKFVHNEGRQELMRGFIGAGGLKRYFEGLVQFLKMAYEHQSCQVCVGGGPIPFSIYLWREQIVQQVTCNAAFSIIGASAFSVVGDKCESYKGILKMNLQQFCIIGNKSGHSIALSA